MSVVGNFRVLGRLRLDLRGEAYDLTNTPRWGNPTHNVNNAAFGQILSASGERELQVALRITF